MSATDKTTPGQEARAARNAPEGYTLWATYPSRVNAELARERYGAHDDVIKPVPRSKRWALYGREA